MSYSVTTAEPLVASMAKNGKNGYKILHRIRGGCKHPGERTRVHLGYARAMLILGKGRLCDACWAKIDWDAYLDRRLKENADKLRKRREAERDSARRWL